MIFYPKEIQGSSYKEERDLSAIWSEKRTLGMGKWFQTNKEREWSQAAEKDGVPGRNVSMQIKTLQETLKDTWKRKSTISQS